METIPNSVLAPAPVGRELKEAASLRVPLGHASIKQQSQRQPTAATLMHTYKFLSAVQMNLLISSQF